MFRAAICILAIWKFVGVGRISVHDRSDLRSTGCVTGHKTRPSNGRPDLDRADIPPGCLQLPSGQQDSPVLDAVTVTAVFASCGW